MRKISAAEHEYKMRVVKTAHWAAPFSFLMLIIFSGMAYWAIDIHTFTQYFVLPKIIEHNRYIFIILYIPVLTLFIFTSSSYALFKRTYMPPKYEDCFGKALIYGGFGALILTPIFSIASGIYLNSQGYERCPSNEKSLYAGIRTLDYAKSLEYCPRLG